MTAGDSTLAILAMAGTFLGVLLLGKVGVWILWGRAERREIRRAEDEARAQAKADADTAELAAAEYRELIGQGDKEAVREYRAALARGELWAEYLAQERQAEREAEGARE